MSLRIYKAVIMHIKSYFTAFPKYHCLSWLFTYSVVYKPIRQLFSTFGPFCSDKRLGMDNPRMRSVYACFFKFAVSLTLPSQPKRKVLGTRSLAALFFFVDGPHWLGPLGPAKYLTWLPCWKLSTDDCPGKEKCYCFGISNGHAVLHGCFDFD